MNKAAAKQTAQSVLGLALNGNKLEGAWVRRTNGSTEVRKVFSVTLALDALSAEPELVGREIRNHLESAGIRERRAVVAVPASWAMTLGTRVAEVPEEDVSSFLQIEAERGFPYGIESLITASSLYRSPNGDRHATQIAVQRDHLLRVESVLKAAKLKPVSMALGVHPLIWPNRQLSEPVITLDVSEDTVSLVVTCDEGVAALRVLHGALAEDNPDQGFRSDFVAREVRISLGQLPGDMRDAMRVLRVVGKSERARKLASDIQPRAEAMGLTVQRIEGATSKDLGSQAVAGEGFGVAVSLAAFHLNSRSTGCEFLPPRTSAWKEFTEKHSAKKLAWAVGIAAGILLVVSGAFAYQQVQLSRLKARWSVLSPRVSEVENLQQQIRRFRPWFDESVRTLSVLKGLTEAFPEDGSVTAKSIEIRGSTLVTCSGTARDSVTLYQALDRLGSVPQVSGVKLDNSKGGSPLQYTFNFQWGEGGNHDR